MRDDEVSAALLAWYDGHARVLPWRIGPEARKAGVLPDPYRVWLSEIMLQQTTVAAVKAYFQRFTHLWPDVAALAAAEDAAVMAEWAGLGYYARARNLLACARAVVAEGGFPTGAEALQRLPGIGPYTAAAIAAIAQDQPAVVVDGNVERVVSRLFAIETPLPAARPEIRAATARISPMQRPGDFAQAMMDLGATICTPRNPVCALCPLRPGCAAQRLGLQSSLPRKAAKAVKPSRQGVVWVARRADGALLLERRPDKGLLGGTLGFPSSGWDGQEQPAPLEADWAEIGCVTHTFTHFHLTLSVLTAEIGPNQGPPLRGDFMGANVVGPDHLTTLMRKAHDLVFAA